MGADTRNGCLVQGWGTPVARRRERPEMLAAREQARNDANRPHGRPAAWHLPDSVLGKLRAQGVAIEPQHAGGLRLVSAGAMHDRREQRSLDIGYHHVVDAVWRFAVQLAEIFLERLLDAAANLIGAV